jgi:hypothetical protein
MSLAGLTPGVRKNLSGLSDLPATLTFMEYQQVTELVASMRLDPYCPLPLVSFVWSMRTRS